jgi:hypothetical protein
MQSNQETYRFSIYLYDDFESQTISEVQQELNIFDKTTKLDIAETEFINKITKLGCKITSDTRMSSSQTKNKILQFELVGQKLNASDANLIEALVTLQKAESGDSFLKTLNCEIDDQKFILETYYKIGYNPIIKSWAQNLAADDLSHFKSQNICILVKIDSQSGEICKKDQKEKLDIISSNEQDIFSIYDYPVKLCELLSTNHLFQTQCVRSGDGKGLNASEDLIKKQFQAQQKTTIQKKQYHYNKF